MSNLLIETTLLNTFLDEHSWTYVKAGNDFVRKKARDLNKGDLVVIKNEAIHKTLDEIIPILKQSMRYQIAEETIHEKNCNNEYIPKLRTLLLKGLADPNTEQLEQKILKEGIDFTSKEYAEFKKVICNIVDLGEDAVNSWLKGETLAPANWENFQKLISINSAFEEIYQSYQKDSGYYANYQLYVGSRRTIMSYLAKRTGNNKKSETKGKSEEQKPEQKSNERKEGIYTDEIELVVSHFIKEIDDTYSAARITKIKKVEEKKKNGKNIGKNGHKPEPNLKKAIITEELPELKLKDMEQINNYHYILLHSLNSILCRYIDYKIDHTNNTKITTKEMTAYSVTAPQYLFSRIITITPMEKIMVRKNLKITGKGLKYGTKNIEDNLEESYIEFITDLTSNRIDELLKLELHTIAHIIDYVNEYRNILPKAYFEAETFKLEKRFILASISINKKTNRKQKKENEKEIKEFEKKYEAAAKYLQQIYNINFKDNKKLFSIFYHQEINISAEIENIDYLRKMKQLYESQGYKFYERDEVMNILTELKILSAIKVYPKNTFI